MAVHAVFRRRLGVPGSRTFIRDADMGERRLPHRLQLCGPTLGVTVLADLGPSAVVAGPVAWRQRNAHDHRRLQPQERHPILAERAVGHIDGVHVGAGELCLNDIRREHLVKGAHVFASSPPQTRGTPTSSSRSASLTATVISQHRYDVVIVGAGGAGMRAAVEAGPRVRTAVLTKLYPTRSHTGAAQGGMCAALANVEDDNWEWHTFDTVKGGDYLADQDAVEIMCREAIEAVLDLEKMGMPFNRTPEGRIDQRRFGGHTRDHGKAPVRRACYAADRTGHMILQTLYQNCVKHDVEFFNEFYALDLVITRTPSGAVATGVVAYDLATGEVHVFHCKAVVIATGGSGRMYKTTSNAHTLTGDGIGIVFRKGLPLEDVTSLPARSR